MPRARKDPTFDKTRVSTPATRSVRAAAGGSHSVLRDPSGKRVKVNRAPMPQVPESSTEDLYRSVGMTQKSLAREVQREMKAGNMTPEQATATMEKSKKWPVK